MAWQTRVAAALCVVCVGCSSPSRDDRALTTTSVPRSTREVVRSTAVASGTTVLAPVTSRVLGVGPTDAEIQTILTDLDQREAVVFAAFKKTLLISPALDRLIESTYGPSADSVRESLASHARDGGMSIRESPGVPRTALKEVISRSDECFVVKVDADLSPMLTRARSDSFEVFRNTVAGWRLVSEIEESGAEGFRGAPCDIA